MGKAKDRERGGKMTQWSYTEKLDKKIRCHAALAACREMAKCSGDRTMSGSVVAEGRDPVSGCVDGPVQFLADGGLFGLILGLFGAVICGLDGFLPL
jgi:hypothetical protein